MVSVTIHRALKQLSTQVSESRKPIAVILAGHNGSGKSTLWYKHLVSSFQIPLLNADRVMLSILPEVTENASLPKWAIELRDTHESWMRVAQRGVEAFVAQALAHKLPFAQETVFSHWKRLPGGKYESKIDLITRLQGEGYFVLLTFVGLTSSILSIARVKSRKADGGHDVETAKLLERFPRTQRAISQAIGVADYAILFDNSRSLDQAFTIARIQARDVEVFDIRNGKQPVPYEISTWLNVISPPSP